MTTRMRWKPPSPLYATREEAVADQRKRMKIRGQIRSPAQAPHAMGYILRDACDNLIPPGQLNFINFRGTYPLCSGPHFRHIKNNQRLRVLGVRVKPDGQPIYLEDPDDSRMKHTAVRSLVSVDGDLIRPPHDPMAKYRTRQNPFTRREEPADPRLRCFGVPFWRAIGLECHKCSLRKSCDLIIDYRLTFGGRRNFDRALGQRSKFERRHGSDHTGMLRMHRDLDIGELITIYAGLWYVSDMTVDKRVRDRLWEADAPAREEILAARRVKEVAASKAVMEAHRRVEADRAAFELLAKDEMARRVAGGRDKRLSRQLRDFMDRNAADNRWRKRRSAANAIAIVQVAKEAMDAALAAAATGKRFATKKLLSTLACDAPSTLTNPEELGYDKVYRHLRTLDDLVEAGVDFSEPGEACSHTSRTDCD